MEVNIDELLLAVAPEPTSIVFGGKKYKLRELAVAEALKIDSLNTMKDVEQLKFVTSLFDGKAPPLLEDLKKSKPSVRRGLLLSQYSLLVNVISIMVEEQSRKKTSAAIVMFQTRLTTPPINPELEELPG